MVVIVALASVEFLLYGWKVSPFSRAEFLFPDTPLTHFAQTQPQPIRVVSNDSMPANMWMPFGLEAADGYDAVYPYTEAKFISLLNSNDPDSSAMSRYGRIESFHSPLLDLANVGLILTVKKGDGQLPVGLRGSHFEKVFEDKTSVVLKNPTALPRAFMAQSWQYASSEKEVTQFLVTPGNVAQKRIVVTGKDLPLPEQGSSGGSADYLSYANNRSKIAVEATAAGYLLISDTWYPGWKATVDGQATTIHQADLTFRAIAVPAGKHTVEMWYDPMSFKLGLIISSFSFVTLGGILIFSLKKKRYG